MSARLGQADDAVSKPRQGRDGFVKAPHKGQRGEGQHQGHHQPHRYHSSKAWWSVGEFRHQGITHQSVGLSLGQNEDDFWDLSDSLVDLYEHVTKRQKKAVSRIRTHSRSGSFGAMGGLDIDTQADIQRWLDEDSSHGFIRVFASDADSGSRLFPCNLSTMAQKICLQLGIPGNSLHVQLSGHVIKRMEPFDCPLAIQNEYLAGLGYSDKRYIQEEGPKEDLSYLVRFYAGKPLSDYTYARNQLITYAYVRKGKLRHQWVRRRCVISGTRLLIYRENEPEPTTVQLAKGSVEEVQVKGQSLVIKLTSTLQGERSIFISFVSQDDYSKWLKKFKKATAKLPSKADLSNCHLEFLPETVFINTDLQVLILRHNALRERPFDEDIYTIGWLDDLPRFSSLRCLNLADNQLTSFPMALCEIHSLMELNLASNKLAELPAQIYNLKNLQVLHLHNNLLSSLPEEIALMSKLSVVVLAFNRFVHIPTVLLQSLHANFKLDSIIMAGNQISRLPADQLIYMTHIKKIDLRLNRLQLLPTETAKFQSLEHVTHLDIRENEVLDLDIRAIRSLEYVNCDRNGMRSMQLHGLSLKNLFASKNCLHSLSINPKPEYLVSMDVSHNKLMSLPDWLADCFFLVRLDVSHNYLKSLPDRLLCGTPKLRILKANHNRLSSMPNQVISETLEELHLQHNLLRSLSPELFMKAQRLRYLNVTRNKVSGLPSPNKNESFNKLQELYLSFNHLDNEVWQQICCFPRLRVLHVARNRISVIAETDVEKLEQLTELNISSNNLTYLPSSLGRHPKLQILRASCNLLQELPNFKNSSALKVLEASSNHLVNVNMANLMASQVSLLDISANPNVTVKSHHMDAAKNSKHLCLVDMWGQNRSLEDLSTSNQQTLNQLWQTGLSQTSGQRNKLCVATLSKPKFSDNGDALFAIFDGGRNDTVASILCDIMPTILKEERLRNKNAHMWLKYTMLSAHRHLKSHGQKLGASSVVAFIHPNDKGQHVLSIANVGDCQVVLCRHRKAMCLSRPFLAEEDREDTSRVIRAGGIITEDGRVSGVTYNTRLLGCSYLFPHVIPEPFVTSTLLTPEDTFFIVGSHGLWEYVSHDEATREVKDIPDPVIAAKRLQDLAQGYGSRENLAIVVVRLTLTPNEQTRISDQMRTQKSGEKELIKILSQRNNLLHLRYGVPKDADVDDIIIDKAGHAKNKKHRSSRKHLLEAANSEKSSLYSYESNIDSKAPSAFFDRDKVTSMEHHGPRHDSNKYELSTDLDSHTVGSFEKHEENRLYIKKNDVAAALRKRITDDLKSKELKNTFEVEMNEKPKIPTDDFDDENDEDIFVHDIDLGSNWTAAKVKKNKPDRSDEWESQLKQRLEHELLDRELKTVSEVEQNTENLPPGIHDKSNWTTISVGDKAHDKPQEHVQLSPRIFSDPVNKLKSTSLPPGMYDKETKLHPEESENVKQWISSSYSEDSIPREVIHMMEHSSHSDTAGPQRMTMKDSNLDGFESIPEEEMFSLSPSESVSSIDVRLQDEADEIYQRHHVTNLKINHCANEESNDDDDDDALNQMAYVENSYPQTGEEVIRRPLSPDSIISLDDFVKPPIDNSNIDRDALLFHQMQMARAQAHAGSSASLDTVQSAPLQLPNRDILADVRASSHSIEVLVNIGTDQDFHSADQGSLKEDGSTATLTGSRSSLSNVNLQAVGKRGSKILRAENINSRPGGKITNSGDEFTNNEHVDDNDVDDSDRDTLVGDSEDIGNQLDVTDDRKERTSLLNVSYPHPGDDNMDGSDKEYDSDDSLGNLSLEDGYDAFEFVASSKRVTLSMNNVLENESDYMNVELSQRNNRKSKLQPDGITPEAPTAGNKTMDNIHEDDNDDYEDIDQNDDDDDVPKENQNEADINYIDDIDPYEVVQCHQPSNPVEVEEGEEKKEIPTEEDIDALYAKVNKIKLKKLLAEENSNGEYFLDFMPEFSPTDHNNFPPHDSQGFSHSQPDTEHRDNYNSTESSDEEREIFITSPDLMPNNARQNNSNRIKHESFNFPPASSALFKNSPPPPKVSSEQRNTIPSRMPPATTITQFSEAKRKSPVEISHSQKPVFYDTQSVKIPHVSSFKPASHSTTVTQATSDSHQKPAIPPKNFSNSFSSPHKGQNNSNFPVHTTTSSTSSSSSSSASSSLHSPRQPPPKMFDKNINRDEAISPRPVPLPRTHVNSPNRTSPVDSGSCTHQQSGPKIHAQIPQNQVFMSVPPVSVTRDHVKAVTPRSNAHIPIDMQPAARQLPTQRSIIITYL